MYKKAKNLVHDDIIVIDETHELSIESIEMLEYAIKIYGFINGEHERTLRYYTYNELVLIKDVTNKTFCEKVMGFLKKCQFF